MFTVEISNKKMNLEGGHNKLYDCLSSDKIFKSYGVYGKIIIGDSEYIIFITGISFVGKYLKSNVLEISKVEFVRLSGPDESHFYKHIRNILEKSGMYFTDGNNQYSIYNNISFKQKGDNIGTEDFIFNHVPITCLEKFDSYIGSLTVKCIQGYLNFVEIGDFKVTLISRRCWKRCGSRYFSRGCDINGYVSNYVETEQIVEIGGELVHSYLQIRGSIPLFWSHKLGLAYAPKIVLKEKNAFKKSDNILTEKYSNVFYLNLIKQSGYEGKIFKAFLFEQNKVNFLNFDFHGSGIAGVPGKDEQFVQSFENIIKKFGEYFPGKFQRGVIRTNCIDCLDRTNLVQYYIAKFVLSQLQIKKPKSLDIKLRGLWFDNGNELSLQYAGTPAIKADIIKHGKITFVGMSRDFYFSVKRYFINRFTHGHLQDALNILTGKNKMLIRKKSYRACPRSILILGIFILFCSPTFNTWVCFIIMALYILITSLRGCINLPISEN